MRRENGGRGLRWIVLLATLLAGGCAGLSEKPLPESYYFWLVHDRDRSDADRVIDQRRQPEKLLAFYDMRPGMRVLDLGAGGGYNTELLARVVGPQGVVYAQNTRYSLDNFVKGRFDERLKKPVMRNVVHAVRDFDDPVPPEARNLDLVTFNFVYHDTKVEAAGFRPVAEAGFLRNPDDPRSAPVFKPKIPNSLFVFPL